MSGSIPPKAPEAPGTQPLLSLLAEVEDRLGQVKAWERGHEQHLRSLQQQMAQVGRERDVLARRQAALALRRQRLARLRQALQERRKAWQAAGQPSPQERDVLYARVQELAQRLQQADDAARLAQAQLAAAQARAQQLEGRFQNISPRLIERIKAADEALRTRKKKLHRYKQVLRQAAQTVKAKQAKVDSLKQQYEGLLQQRQTLVEVKQFLTQSEADMIRRWATPRATGLVVTTLLALVALALGSYAIGYNVVEPTWRATSLVRLASAGLAPGASSDRWLEQQRQSLLGAPVLQESLSQLAQRGLRPFGTVTGLRQELEQSLTVSPAGEGHLLLELRGTDREQIVLVLESVARAVVGRQMVQDREAGRVSAAQVLEAAARDVRPIADPRWTAALIAFAGLVVGSTVALLVLRWSLLRRPRVLQTASTPQIRALEDPDRWPTTAPKRPSRTRADH